MFLSPLGTAVLKNVFENHQISEARGFYGPLAGSRLDQSFLGNPRATAGAMCCFSHKVVRAAINPATNGGDNPVEGNFDVWVTLFAGDDQRLSPLNDLA